MARWGSRAALALQTTQSSPHLVDAVVIRRLARERMRARATTARQSVPAPPSHRMAEPEVRLERISVFFDERMLAYDTGSGFFEYPPQCVPSVAVAAWSRA